MEINTFNTTEGIIDLHIHSDYSYSKDEYMNIGVKPLELLKEIKDFSDKFDCQMVFSLTDHDNIFGAKKIQQEIQKNPDEYKKVKFVSGIEFSVSCEGLGKYKKPKKDQTDKRIEEESRAIVGDLHLLGYKYDINNPVMNYYSAISDIGEDKGFRYGNDIYPYGAIIFAGKKFLAKSGISIPLEKFLDFQLEIWNGERVTFAKNVKSFCSYCLENLQLDEEVVDKMKFFLLGINPKRLFKEKKSYDISLEDISLENVANNSKLDIMEAMAILENAGGVSILAHPNIIELNPKYIDLFGGKTDEYGFIPKKIKGKLGSDNFLDFMNKQTTAKEKLMEYILDKLVNNAYNPITGEKLEGLAGLEVLHKSNMFKKYFSVITDLAKKYDLYITGGSDKHGYKNNVMSIGQIMPGYIENCFPKADKRKSMFSIYGCTFVDDILEGNKLERKRGNDDIEILVKTENKFKIFDRHNTKRFIASYAKSDCYKIAKTCHIPQKQLEGYKSSLNLEPIHSTDF